MKTVESILPSRKEIASLVRSVRDQIEPDFRVSDDPDDETPGISLTVGLSLDGSWSYQTGDNSYTGGAYGHPHWAVVGVYRDSNSYEVADDILDQLAEAASYDFEESQKPATTDNQNPAGGVPNIEIEDRARPRDLANFAWRIRFKNGSWSGWHTGYSLHNDAMKAAKRALDAHFAATL